jgi:hypothetical protein
MREKATAYNLGTADAPDDSLRVPSHPEFEIGEVPRVTETAGFYQADVVFDTSNGGRLKTFPVELLEKTGDLWQRLIEKNF